MKKIWLLCLCLASFSLVGCFHIPDEDWLPNRNKVNTWDTQKDDEMNQALDLFVNWINSISSERDEINNDENEGTTTEEWENVEVEDETINEEKIIDDEITAEEVENEVIEEDIPSEE